MHHAAPAGEDRIPVPLLDGCVQVYDADNAQSEVFAVTARPIVDACMDGYNGTIFAYGQTGG